MNDNPLRAAIIVDRLMTHVNEDDTVGVEYTKQEPHITARGLPITVGVRVHVPFTPELLDALQLLCRLAEGEAFPDNDILNAAALVREQLPPRSER